MRDRVFGIETEYALIYHPARRDAGRPTKLEIFQLFEPAVARRVPGLARAFSLLRSKPGRFLANGASFHYEATPQAFEHGLIELASPECRDPFTLLACERAKDELVEEVCAEVNARLRALGWRGEVRIGKNNVDSRGNTFGSHESYWVEDPLPARRRLLLLPAWLACWALALPVLAWLALVTAGLAAAGLALALLPLLAAGIAAGARRAARGGRPRTAARLARGAGRVAALPERLLARLRDAPGAWLRRLAWLELPLRPVLALHSFVHNRFHFRRLRRDLTAHLVSRTVFAGAGAVRLEGSGGPLFRLAQRPPFLRSLARVFTSGDRRPLFETRDLFFRPWSVFGSRRRLHLMHADANLCDWAQVLRTGTTALVLEAVEAGEAGLPRLADPLAALRALSADVSLTRPLPLAAGGEATALEIQRRYLGAVRRHLARAGLAGEAQARGWRDRVLAMWEETLRLLERDPEALADRVDWVAKRRDLRRAVPEAADREALRRRGGALLAREAAGGPEERRLRELAFRALRADLRYHELGPRGGFRRREARGEMRRLADPEAVERARSEPPRDTRAFARGRALREAAERRLAGGAAWHRVRLGWLDWRFFPDPLDPAPRRLRG